MGARQGSEAPQKVRVWDLPIRLWHWSVLICVVGSWVSVELMEDLDLHQQFGLVLLGLLLFRIIWGFLGSTTSRFSSFLSSPAAAIKYLRAWRSGTGTHYTGHNPLGAYSVIAMLLVMIAQVVMGLFANDELFYEGPLADRISTSLSNDLTELHEWNFYVLLSLVVVHILAIAVYWFRGENLLWPMITGKKWSDDTGEPAPERYDFARSLWR